MQAHRIRKELRSLMGSEKIMLFLVLCSYFHVFSASSLVKTLASSSGLSKGLGDEASHEQGHGMGMIHTRENIAHHGTGGGGSGGVAANGGGGQGGGYGQSGTATAAQGGTAVIPVYAAAGGANNNRHHSGSSSHNSLGLATLFGTALASLGLSLYLAFG